MSFKLSFIEDEIIDQYLHDDSERPWVIGFSGGKDSTMLLQMVWYALKKIHGDLPYTRKIYVVCNDTLVENPKIVEYVDRVLVDIQREAAKQNLPIVVHKTTPRLEDTFWVNLIGKGYPAPNNVFRWCTERLKINPTTKFITQKISEEGEVILLLGTRKAESATRSRSLNKFERKGKRLRRHILPNAFVFAPIKDVMTSELWQYLMQVPSPWGANNKELVSLYKNANSGDCPLVIDTTTPSCGNSRFGCWVCTVVKRDKSMEGLIENGEDWMWPLMELRDLLAESRDDSHVRQKRRRNGQIQEGVMGPYLPSFRATILEKLLQAQKEIQEEQGVDLITHQELVAIQLNWYRDSIFNYKVSDIYNRIYGTAINMKNKTENQEQEEKLLRQAVEDNPDNFDLIQDLLKVQKAKSLMVRKQGLQTEIENIIEGFVDRDRPEESAAS